MSSRSELSERMRRDWDQRAKDDHRFYIASGTSKDLDVFLESGRQEVDQLILDGLELGPLARVLEIGCGVGRLLLPLADRVAHAAGVDISPEMVRLGRELCGGQPNVRLEVTEGDLSMHPDASTDFVFSYIVFQHVPAREPVDVYLREAHRVLKPGGIIRFQVDGRKGRPGLSEPNTYEGLRYGRGDVETMLRSARLDVLDAWGEDTHYFWITAKKAGAGAHVRFRGRIEDEDERRLFREEVARFSGGSSVALESSPRAWLGPFLSANRDLPAERMVALGFRLVLGRAPLADEMPHHVHILDEKLETPENWIDTLVSSVECRDRLNPLLPPMAAAFSEGVRWNADAWLTRHLLPTLPAGDPIRQLAHVLDGLDENGASSLAFAAVFGRDGNPRGLAYHALLIRRSRLTRARLLLDFLNAKLFLS